MYLPSVEYRQPELMAMCPESRVLTKFGLQSVQRNEVGQNTFCGRLAYCVVEARCRCTICSTTGVAVDAMPKSIFTNVLTESNDKARWALAYVLFAVSEGLAVIHAYKSPSRTAIGAYLLVFLLLLPLLSARATLTVLKRNPAIQADLALRLSISMRLWTLVVISYTLFFFTIEVVARSRAYVLVNR